MDGTELARFLNVSREANIDLLWRFSPDAKRLAYQTDLAPNMVGIWSVDRKQLEALLPGSTAYDFGRSGKPQFIGFSPDGRLLALYAHPGTQTVRIWDLEKREAIATANCFAPQWSADGRWFVGTMDPGASLPDEPSNPASAYSNSHGRIVKVWRMHHPPARFALAEPVHTLLFDSVGNRLIANDTLWQSSGAASSAADDLFALVPTPAHLFGEDSAHALRFDDRDQLVRFALPESPFQEQTLRVSSAGSDDWRQLPIPVFPEQFGGLYGDRIEQISDVSVRPNLVAFHPSSKRAAFAAQLSWRQANMRAGHSSSGEELALLRYELDKEESSVANEPQGAHEMGRGIRCLAISPDGKLIATGDRRSVVVRQWSDGGEVGRAELAERWTSEEKLDSGFDSSSGPNPWRYANYFAVNCLAFSPDAKRLIAGAAQGRLAMIERLDDSPMLWQAHQSDIQAVAFHPERQMAVSAGTDRMIRLWNIARAATTGEPVMLAEWEADEDAVTALAFHPGGRYLVSGSAGGVVTIWDLDRMRLVLEQLDLAWEAPPNYSATVRSDAAEMDE